MTPELAKKLENAGFPQNNAKGGRYLPTLSDIMRACGTCLFSLRHTPDNKWIATGRFTTKESKIPYYESAPYDEPDIAVAELFLAMKLNESKEGPPRK